MTALKWFFSSLLKKENVRGLRGKSIKEEQGFIEREIEIEKRKRDSTGDRESKLYKHEGGLLLWGDAVLGAEMRGHLFILFKRGEEVFQCSQRG